MLVAANITMQFGAKPLFENVSVKFGEGYRYGLIGANGAGKSTFMKILAGILESSAGNVSKDSNERMAHLKQDQFAYEDQRVIDVVLMGHAEMWACMSEKDAIYANPEATEDDYMHAAELEGKFAEYDGYTAESRAGELLLGVGIASELWYRVVDTDGTELWRMPVIDASSRRTGSSVFDFEGDGVAEVVYADEETLWVFDGSTGSVEPSWCWRNW